MKKTTLLLLSLCAFVSVSVAAPSEKQPSVSAKQSDAGEIRETWSKLFKGGLFTADYKPVPLSALTEKEFVGVYCSGAWCGPCRAFTPELVKFYNANSDKIEIVFISNDSSKELALKYMKDYKMQWLTSRFGAPENDNYLRRNKILGIPNLRIYKNDGTLVTPNGRDLDSVREIIGGK